MSIWLHDIGKLITPIEIMDKPTRLGSMEQDVRHRIEIGILMERLRGAEDPGYKAEALKKQEELKAAERQIFEANDKGYLSDEEIFRLKELGTYSCLDAEGRTIPLLTERELESIMVQKGTLTEQEPNTIQQHVVHTVQMLKKMRFEDDYAEIPTWAGTHHEYLDGSGYPGQLKAEMLSVESRLLTIIDIYDALTAEDRPYKKPMSPEKAFAVLKDMRDEGKLDGEILELFEKSGAWRRH